jgi:hypothetical protein
VVPAVGLAVSKCNQRDAIVSRRRENSPAVTDTAVAASGRMSAAFCARVRLLSCMTPASMSNMRSAPAREADAIESAARAARAGLYRKYLFIG